MAGRRCENDITDTGHRDAAGLYRRAVVDGGHECRGDHLDIEGVHAVVEPAQLERKQRAAAGIDTLGAGVHEGMGGEPQYTRGIFNDLRGIFDEQARAGEVTAVRHVFEYAAVVGDADGEVGEGRAINRHIDSYGLGRRQVEIVVARADNRVSHGSGAGQNHQGKKLKIFSHRASGSMVRASTWERRHPAGSQAETEQRSGQNAGGPGLRTTQDWAAALHRTLQLNRSRPGRRGLHTPASPPRHCQS